tara:strand:+ start:1698 stop:1823 length:126 start_codon:yes stop_codon:yes gene_type:complete
VAKAFEGVIPVRIFERANNGFFNTLVMIDANRDLVLSPASE